MLIKTFKSNHPYLLVVLFFYALVLWAKPILYPILNTSQLNTEPFNTIINSIVNYSPTFSVLVAFVLVFFQAVMLNNIVVHYTLIEKNTFLPALAYITLMSIAPEYTSLNKFVIFNTILIYVLKKIFNIYVLNKAYSEIFNISLILVLVSFMYFNALYFLIFIWLVFMIYNMLKWREWFIVLIGAGTPFVFISFYCFWINDYMFFKNYISHFTYFSHSYTLNWYKNSTHIILFVLMFIGMLHYKMYASERNIMLRKYAAVLLWLFWFAFFTIFQSSNWYLHLIILFIPSAIFLSLFWLKIKKQWQVHISFMLLLIIFLLNHFFLN